MKYAARIVTVKGCKTIPAETDLIAEMAALGYTHRGDNHNRHNRAELQGAPRFDGLVGPMWDGDALRYEDQKTYNDLST